MALRLTPAVIAGAYGFLRATPPFRTWKLPPATEVEFVVSRHRMELGYHRGVRRKVRSHEIGISENCVGHTNTLLKTMAHEMIHQYQQRARTETPGAEPWFCWKSWVSTAVLIPGVVMKDPRR